MQTHKESSGCLTVLLWPFRALWTLVATIIKLVGRVAAVVIGFLLMIVGALLTVTIIGVVVGVPLVILGIVFVTRGLF